MLESCIKDLVKAKFFIVELLKSIADQNMIHTGDINVILNSEYCDEMCMFLTKNKTEDSYGIKWDEEKLEFVFTEE